MSLGFYQLLQLQHSWDTYSRYFTASRVVRVSAIRFVGVLLVILLNVGDDPTREVLNYVFSNGSQVVATDGRRLVMIDAKALIVEQGSTSPAVAVADAGGRSRLPLSLRYTDRKSVV